MLTGLFALLLCQVFGEGVVRLLGVSVPGPIVGLLAFLAWLHWRKPPAHARVVRAADRVLDDIGVLFVPPAVGVIQYGGLLAEHWAVIAVGLLVSWLAALLLSSAAMGLVIRLEKRFGEGPHWQDAA